MKSIGEKCAVFGIYGKDLDVSRLTFFGLHALQHRGQDACGVATSDGIEYNLRKGDGLLRDIFDEEKLKRMVLTYNLSPTEIDYYK